MAKRLSAQAKSEILDLFVNNKFSIDKLSNKFQCTAPTITRNLKKELGSEKYQEIIDSRKYKKNAKISNKQIKSNKNENNSKILNEKESQFDFVELVPLDYEIDNVLRKELSSISINDIDLPKVVYMIVDKKNELEIKLLKDYPDWDFLPNEDLNRKTIEIYLDMKIAKRICSKEQKVIKVPNTDVFRIAAPILNSRGISRIVSPDKLIAL